MPNFTYIFLSAVGFFFIYAIVHSLISPPQIRRIYLLYATYLFFIFTYFILKENTADGSGVDLGNLKFETAYVSAIAIAYLSFDKAFFYGRESYQYFRVIANAGLYAVLFCLIVEILLDYFNVPPINLIEGFLRALLAFMGIYAITFTYIKVPQDRNLSLYFVIGNYIVLVGGIATASFTIMDSSIYNFMPYYNKYAPWIKTFELLPIQTGIILEMFCFSIAIVKRRELLPKPLELNQIVPQPEVKPLKEDTLAQRIAFRTSTGFEILKKQDIIFLEGGGNSANFVKLHMEGSPNPIPILHTLSNCLSLLSDEQNTFIQPHKSYIINVQKLKSLGKDKDGVDVILMSNKKEIPIPKGKKEAITKLLQLR